MLGQIYFLKASDTNLPNSYMGCTHKDASRLGRPASLLSPILFEIYLQYYIIVSLHCNIITAEIQMQDVIWTSYLESFLKM